MPLLDLKGIKRMVSMDQLLSRYHVNLRKVNHVQFRGRCPLPTHSSTESKESFNVNTEKNIWSCLSDSCVKARGRKGGNVLDFVSHMEKCSIVEAGKKLLEWGYAGVQAESKVQERTAPANGASKPESVPAETEDASNPPLAFTLKGVTYHAYLRDRGITEGTAQFFGVGYFPGKGSMANRIVIPIKNREGQLVAYAGRSLNGDEPRYKLPPGFQKHLVLFNLDQVGDQTDCIVIVEGFFACMKVFQAGYRNVVAMMGRMLTAEQVKLLMGFEKIVILADPDEPGIEAAHANLDALAKHSFVRLIIPPKQPDELGPDEIKQMLDYQSLRS